MIMLQTSNSDRDDCSVVSQADDDVDVWNAGNVSEDVDGTAYCHESPCFVVEVSLQNSY